MEELQEIPIMFEDALGKQIEIGHARLDLTNPGGPVDACITNEDYFLIAAGQGPELTRVVYPLEGPNQPFLLIYAYEV